MGLSVRDDPKKVVDVAGRAWGEPVQGLALSVILKPRLHDDEPPSISAAIHNQSAETQRIMSSGWLSFFQIAVTAADGSAVPMTAYGRERMKPERWPAPTEVTLAPNEAIEADIPVGTIYRMPKGRYRARAFADLPGGRMTSNEIEVTC